MLNTSLRRSTYSSQDFFAKSWYSHLSNRREGGAKVDKSINVEKGINKNRMQDVKSVNKKVEILPEINKRGANLYEEGENIKKQ